MKITIEIPNSMITGDYTRCVDTDDVMEVLEQQDVTGYDLFKYYVEDEIMGAILRGDHNE